MKDTMMGKWFRAVAIAAALAGMSGHATAVGQREAQAQAGAVAGAVISVEADQAQYRVDEQIRFSVESQRAGYLYMFAIDSESGAAYFLEPAPYRDALRVVPGMSFEVPPPGVEFYADRAGVERVVAIASPRRIDLSELDALAADDGAIELADVRRVFARAGLDVSRAGVRTDRTGWWEVRFLDVEVVDGDEDEDEDEVAEASY